MGIRITSNTLTKGLKRGPSMVDRALYAVVTAEAPRVQGKAQADAPWVDQTGNARQGLTAKGFREGRTYGIDLFHTMPYGVWLEVRWSGAYAVIMPTVLAVAPEVMSGMRNLLERMR